MHRVHAIRRSGALALAMAAAGCGGSTNLTDGGASPDLTTTGAPDLAAPDLATSGAPDLTMTGEPDLAAPDLATDGATDLATPDDMAPNGDLAGAADLAGGGGDGGGAFGDLAQGADLTMAPDLLPGPDLLPSPDLTPPCVNNAACMPPGENLAGLCKMATCVACTDGSDDAACTGAYGNANTPYLCVGGACVPGNCRADGDCPLGQLCGATTPNLCGKCLGDQQCQADPTYGPGTICNLAAGTCGSSMCALPDDTACAANAGDVCCNKTCVPGACCDSAFCHDTKGNDFTCVNHVCTRCDQATNDTYYVDPVNGSDASGTGATTAGGQPSPACAFKTITRALAVLGPSPTPGTQIVILGANVAVGAGETFPLAVPPKTTVAGQMKSAAIKVPPKGSAFVLGAPGATLASLTIDGQTHTGYYGVLVGKGCDATCTIKNVAVQNTGKDGILVGAGALTIGAGTTVTGAGTLAATHSGLHVAGGNVVIDNPAGSAPIAFNDNSAHGILVDLIGSVNITGVPSGGNAGTVVANANNYAGLWIETTPGKNAPRSLVRGIVAFGQTGGNGMRIIAGSSIEVRGSVLLGNAGNGVHVSPYVAGKMVSNDVSMIDLGAPNDPGGNTLQATQGMGNNDNAGICLTVAPNSGKLLAEGNVFAGPIDCSKPNAGKIRLDNRCGAADVGVTGANNTIDVANCTTK